MKACLAAGCDRNAKARFCQGHQTRIGNGVEREVDLLPKCSVCGTAMREPAELCGFCEIEHPRTAA